MSQTLKTQTGPASHQDPDNQHHAVAGGWKRKLVVCAVVIGILALAVIGLGLMAAGKKPPEAKKRRNPTLAVTAERAFSDSVVLDVLVQGQTRPRTEVDVSPQVGGKVIYVSPQFVAGGQFKKGDVLLKLEEADFNVAVLRAEAGVARAEPLVIREMAEGEIARQDWADLGRGGEPSPLTLREPQLAEAKANLLSAQADLDNAKLQLSRTIIRAPFNGRIRERFADIGQFVSPGTRLARVFSTEAVEVPLSLNDADLARVDIPVSMAISDTSKQTDVLLSAVIAGKRQEWNGKVVRTDGTFDPQTRTLSAIVEVKDPYGKGASADGTPLPPGLFVDADIVGRTLENSIVIPRDGLRPDDKVYIVNDKGEAQSRDVVVLDTNSERAVLKSGIEAGEYVIISPLEKSQLSLSFKVLDSNDPTKVIIEPPAPDWAKAEKNKTDNDKKDDKEDNLKKGAKKPGDGRAKANQSVNGGN